MWRFIQRTDLSGLRCRELSASTPTLTISELSSSKKIAEGVSLPARGKIGRSVICAGAEIGEDCMISGCIVGENVSLQPGTKLESAVAANNRQERLEISKWD